MNCSALRLNMENFNNDLPHSENTKRDDLGILVREIYEVIDTYYLEWQAYEVKQVIIAYLLKKGITRDTR